MACERKNKSKIAPSKSFKRLCRALCLSRKDHMATRFLTVKDLAELLNLKESWIYDRTSRNGPEVIPHVKFGRQVRFDVESQEFQAWLKSHGIIAEPRSLTA